MLYVVTAACLLLPVKVQDIVVAVVVVVVVIMVVVVVMIIVTIESIKD